MQQIPILENYLAGQWQKSTKDFELLKDASTGENIAQASVVGINIESAFSYARENSSILRNLTFHERARALKALALHLLSKKENFYNISFKTGATKVDSWIDIEGGIGNLFIMSSLGRRNLPDKKFIVDGQLEQLSKNGTFKGLHLLTTKKGVALHINAFNFPIWGMLEKLAVNFLAGMPAIIKPATSTSFLTEFVVKEIIKSNILPKGSLQLICGRSYNLMDFVDYQDVITFTGSATTGQKLKTHPNVIKNSVPFNLEADSLNCSILGEDVKESDPEFEIFIKEVVKEMTVKCGQKCTAIRRIIIPENMIELVSEKINSKLQKNTIGDPRTEGVRMGPLASLEQKEDVLKNIKLLQNEATLLSESNFNILSGDKEKGAFINPTLFLQENPLQAKEVHQTEAFGPVSTLLPYKNRDEAIQLANLGKGSLAGSIVSADNEFITEVVLETACNHGRMVLINKDNAKENTGHGSPLPQLVHGGPGRAGGGEEMGGLRGVYHYMQRSALQGHPETLTHLTEQFHDGACEITPPVHPFKLHYQELKIGYTHTTHKRTITEYDIVQFANVSWDHFYAHTDTTSLEGTIFKERVAHGYFILAAAAGLFVDPPKGPVIANYGLDEFRFTKPVYAGATIYVKLTVKEKVDQEVKESDELQIPRGVVKWLVQVFDFNDDELVATGTVLTLVKKL